MSESSSTSNPFGLSNQFGVLEVAQEVRIAAEPRKVWKALTEQIGAWWPKSFYVGQQPQRFVLEPKLGGRMFEDWGDEQGLLWKTVIGLVHDEWLMLSGELWPAFGGPAHEFLKIELVRDGKQTVVKTTASIFGKVTKETGESIDQGWKFLFDECLKPFVESGKQPERPSGVR